MDSRHLDHRRVREAITDALTQQVRIAIDTAGGAPLHARCTIRGRNLLLRSKAPVATRQTVRLTFATPEGRVQAYTSVSGSMGVGWYNLSWPASATLLNARHGDRVASVRTNLTLDLPQGRISAPVVDVSQRGLAIDLPAQIAIPRQPIRAMIVGDGARRGLVLQLARKNACGDRQIVGFRVKHGDVTPWVRGRRAA